MDESKLIEKALNTYMNTPGTIVEHTKILHITKKRYMNIIKENFVPLTIESREQAWEEFKKAGSEKSVFYRRTGLDKKSVVSSKVLIGLVMTAEEIEKEVSEGTSLSELLTMIDMPTVNKAMVHNHLGRLDISYTHEAISSIKSKVFSDKYLNDPEWVERKMQRSIATYQEHYGVDNPFQSKEIKEKIKITNKERYKFENPLQNEEIKNKAVLSRAETQRLRGREIKKKTEDTNMDRYGFPYSAQSPEIYAKTVATNNERYGHSSATQSEDVKSRTRKTNIERYEFPSFSQSTRWFIPTKYVRTKEDSIRVTEDSNSLLEFLKDKFPDRNTFTLHEVAMLTGSKYGYIATKFGTHLDFIVPSKQGHLPEHIQGFLEELGYVAGEDFIVNDRQAIKPQEIDFYFPKQKVGIEVNDIGTHNVTQDLYGKDPKPKNYHMEKSRQAKEQGIRLIHAWEHYFNDPQQYEVLKNAIKHALGISKNRVYARNTYVKEVPNVTLKDFFNTNNIQGFRGAKTAYALFDKKTDEVLMAYSVGASHFAHNKYDMELIRGASKLDTTIVGGASKLWKFIIDNNPEVNSIVYYIDRNIYNGSSISTLEGNLELVSTQVGFWNYFVDNGEMKNRQPSKHKEIKELVAQGRIWEVYNAGTETYVWTRK